MSKPDSSGPPPSKKQGSALTVPPPTHRREEDESGFTSILRRLIDATPGAIAAALVDAEGETVDYVGASLAPFDLKVAAAEFRIVLAQIERGKLSDHGGGTRRMEVRAARRTLVVDALPDGYALLSVLHANAAFGHANRALDAALQDLYREAGWNAPPELTRWHPVEVKVAPQGTPRLVRVDLGWRPVAVIGRVATGLQRGEIGYRVALQGSETEVTLVRGRDERWWADLARESLDEG